MEPADDPLWPHCSKCNEGVNAGWCEHVRQDMIENRDLIKKGTRVCVPILPARAEWAEVSISPNLIADICADAALVIPGALFSDEEEELVSLGLWSKGEGRLVLAEMISQWIKSLDTEVCTWGTHGLSEEMQLQSIFKKDALARQANLWSIATRSRCLICSKKSSEWDQIQLSSDTNFGLNSISDSSRDKSFIQQQLQHQYGKRKGRV